jgi:hypothetical protein
VIGGLQPDATEAEKDDPTAYDVPLAE